MSRLFALLFVPIQWRLLRLGVVAQVVALTVGATVAAAASPATLALAYDAGAKALLKAQVDGLYRSTDDGSSWQPVPLPSRSVNTPITAIAAPAGGGAIYIAGPSLGIFRGDAGGGNWKAVSDGLPSQNVVAVAEHTTQPDTLYAYLPEGGIYRSQDAGQTWKLMDRGPDGIRQLIHTDLAGSMETGWLYAATAKGASVSMDCFCLWRDLGDFGGPVRSIAFQPGQPETLYAAAEGGMFRSDDGGRAWEKVTAPDSEVAALAVSPSGTLYAVTVDGKVFRSDDRALTWKQAGA